METQLTIRDFKTEQANKEECRNIGEVVALKLEVLVEAHDGGILEDDISCCASEGWKCVSCNRPRGHVHYSKYGWFSH